jgi:hypothetical protein
MKGATHMLSTDAVKQAFFARVANGLLTDERGNERSVNEVTLVFSQAPLADVADWMAEYKREQGQQ